MEKSEMGEVSQLHLRCLFHSGHEIRMSITVQNWDVAAEIEVVLQGHREKNWLTVLKAS